MKTPSFHAKLVAIAVFVTGCSSATSSEDLKIVPTPWPLTFERHDFAAHCYNTLGCSTIYANNEFSRLHRNTATPPPSHENYQEDWPNASYMSIKNFPAPAHVTWTSLDGTHHVADVDIGCIFKGSQLLHKVAREDIPEGWPGDASPNIYLEVNDHTLSVYMRAHVATKQLQTPGNRYSDYRNGTTLAWTHYY